MKASAAQNARSPATVTWTGFALYMVCALLLVSLSGLLLRSAVESSLPQRRLATHSHSSPAAGRTPGEDWKTLEAVGGLKNEEVAVFVTSFSRSHKNLLRERVLPGAHTWMRAFARVFVLLDDTFEVRFLLRHCALKEFDEISAFSCRNEPTYLLARQCVLDAKPTIKEAHDREGEETKWANSCKLDAMVQFYFKNEALLERVKYVLHVEDDTYVRANRLLAYLAALDRSTLSGKPAAELPLIGNGVDKLTRGVVSLGEKEVCKEAIVRHGEYHPLLLNKAALLRMKAGSKALALAHIYSAFRTPPHVTVAIYAWVLQLSHITLPGIQHNTQSKSISVLQPGDIFIFNVHPHPDEGCSESNPSWPVEHLYEQKMILTCGYFDRSLKKHDPHKSWANMFDVYTHYQEGHLSADGIAYEKVTEAHAIEGYKRTEHSRKYHVLDQWTDFTPSDCKLAPN